VALLRLLGLAGDLEHEDREFGWRCPSDRGETAFDVRVAMDARNPFLKHGIHTLAGAQARGCVFATYPDVAAQRASEPRLPVVPIDRPPRLLE
jgi:hypothetical protein